MRYPGYIEEKYLFPDFFRVELTPPSMGLSHPVRDLKTQLAPALDTAGIRAGQTVAIGVGSRGIANIKGFVACISACISAMGAEPVIIPAMGSHGSATAQGQVAVLKHLGITPETCGAPISPQMDVTPLGRVLGEVPVLFSTRAMACDHSIIINRIKPHTKFKGPMESGLFKMMVVGLGKHEGALAYHSMALKHGFFRLLKAMGEMMIEKSNIRLAVGVVEDAYDETMAVSVIPAQKIPKEEPRLLETAKAHFPKLPFDTLDVLVIRQVGKEISGSGMDPNVTGRTYDLMEDDFSASLEAKRVAVLNLSAKTCGNGIGIGNADIITEKVFQNLDYEATLMNALTSVSLRKAFIPVRLATEEKAIQAAFQTIGPKQPDQVRAVILNDTMHTTRFLVSRALKAQTRGLDRARVLDKVPLVFNASGDLFSH